MSQQHVSRAQQVTLLDGHQLTFQCRSVYEAGNATHSAPIEASTCLLFVNDSIDYRHANECGIMQSVSTHVDTLYTLGLGTDGGGLFY